MTHPEYIRAVKDCIEALRGEMDFYHLGLLEALLPKPDHAKAAVEAFEEQDSENDPTTFDYKTLRFARWAEQQGVDFSKIGGE